MLSTEIIEFIDSLIPDLVGFRRETHANPEIGMHVEKTTARAKALLEKYGIQAEYVVDNVGLKYYLEGVLSGKSVLLRGDLDAIPVNENNDLSFRSTVPGVMHACGHDLNTTFVLGAAIVAHKFQFLVRGNVMFFWQPAEETAQGARVSIENGLLDGISPDFGLCFHASTSQDVGKVALYHHEAMAAADEIEIIVKGKGGHAAFTHITLDPIVVSGHILVALQTFAARYRNPLDPLVVTICKIRGGDVFNAIPEEVQMYGTVRSFNKELHSTLGDKITKLCKSIAEGYGTECDVVYRNVCPSIIVSPDLFDYAYPPIAENIGYENVEVLEQPMMGAEDFGFFNEMFPCNQIRIGSRFDDPRSSLSVHNPSVIFSEDCIPVGVKTICSLIMG